MKHNIKKVCVDCEVCGSKDRKILTTGREHEFETTTDDYFSIVQCVNCGFIFLSPRPDVSELSVIYPNDYYSYNDNWQKKDKKTVFKLIKDYLVDNFGYSRYIRKIFAKYVKNRRDIKVLDVGCGIGIALDVFQKISNGKANTYGVDFHAGAVEVAKQKGHKIFKGIFEEIQLPQEYFDVIYSSNVIEHVVSPKIFMEKISYALKPDGVFLCETPNIDSLDAIILRRTPFWGGFHFPRHWSLFSRETIQRLGNQYGLNIKEVMFQPAPIFWIWTFHGWVFRLSKNKRLADLLFPSFENKKNILYSLFLKVNFTVWDLVIKALTGQTSMMGVIFTK